MKENNRDEVARHFAESLVATMLQRSGAEFFHAKQPLPVTPFDFVVKDGDSTYGIEVKYVDKAAQAKSLWQDWQKAKSAGHLIVVSGRGDKVFADPTLAPMLMADSRTTLSVFK
jgi:predicted AAA+ superfamily ATPase